ncbi:MAG: hypothetical protein HY432_02965 [Candidatus Liptonbacteria bacterium]|nr:hypothetical protein [Candidatus Liptonbacteria bacterium]
MLSIYLPKYSWFVILAIMLWTLPWKGVALWKAANRKEKWWFIALLVINTFAILEIVYIFHFSKKEK